MKIDKENLDKLKALKNERVNNLVEGYAKKCRPSKITVLTDSREDINYVRELSLKNKEEAPLKMKGHSIHFDGYFDQGRDKENTRVLLPEGKTLCKHIMTREREEGLREIEELLDGIMEGREMLVRFYCLGPLNSKFSILALQLTDSAYVAHGEDMLYRNGYEAFKTLKNKDEFFYFIHSSGDLEGGASKNIDKRRIYIDLAEERVFTINNQYAGNSVGLKKLALRLAISRANKEDWLCEHMFACGVHYKDRVTYMTGAFPSACGKTSTAMLPGNTIIGDDIVYIRPGEDGRAYAVNVEEGIFGIIQDVNPSDDPIINKALTTPRELIFSNVLVKDGRPHWLGMGEELPTSGFNYAGEWKKGDKGPGGKEILPAHKNARYIIRLEELDNVDKNLHNPEGVPVRGFIYGGRDSDTSVPVLETLGWHHGVFMGACLESETTSATLGEEGKRKHDPMANIDFLVVPLGVYIKNHLKFGQALDMPPKIFITNYFLKENGKYLNGMLDKLVWLHWMERRIHNEFQAIQTPVGFIPKYEDLVSLFKDLLNKEYTKEDYNKQFTIRMPELLDKFDRIEDVYQGEELPDFFPRHLSEQKQRLTAAKEKTGKEHLLPSDFLKLNT